MTNLIDITDLSDTDLDALLGVDTDDTDDVDDTDIDAHIDAEITSNVVLDEQNDAQ